VVGQRIGPFEVLAKIGAGGMGEVYRARVAADRDTSVSALMTEALDRLADEDRRYSAARRRGLAALRSARSLGTHGQRTWSRDELHDR
jgi:hypothetical protein